MARRVLNLFCTLMGLAILYSYIQGIFDGKGFGLVFGSMLLDYPLLGAVVLLFFLILFGRFKPAVELGISNLFWNDRSFRPFFAGMGSALLMTQILVLNYYFDQNKRQTNDQLIYFLDSFPARLLAAGQARAFEETLRIPLRHDGTPDVDRFTEDNSLRLKTFVYSASVPFLALLLMPAVFPKLRGDIAPRTRYDNSSFPTWTAGVIAALLLVVLTNQTTWDHKIAAWLASYPPLAWIVDWMSTRLSDLGIGPARGEGMPVRMDAFRRDYSVSIFTAILQIFLYNLFPFLIYHGGPSKERRPAKPAGFKGALHRLAKSADDLAKWFRIDRLVRHRSVTPAFALCMLFALIAVIYIPIAYLTHGYQLPIYVTLFLVIVLTNSRPFKLRFLGMDAYYGVPAVRRRRDPATRKLVDLRSAPLAPNEILLDDQAVLKKWANSFSQEEDLPKLVVLAVTGGAIRSATWVAVVLEKLEALIGPRFSKHVRIVTGASGGMVGAAHYVASLKNGNSLDRMADRITNDSLLPVASQMILRDIPSIVWPFDLNYDRGWALEETWASLTVRPDADGPRGPMTFRDLRDDESSGALPSLIFSPVLIEDGRRLFISNLDTDRLTRTEGNVLLDPPSSASHGRSYSTSAVEFFRLFPEAGDFRVSTAVRMNASFPYVSPMLSLPTVQMRRVADAGYYDNFGVNLATRWLHLHRRWLVENTSGVVLIQIRDGMSEEARHRIDMPDQVSGRFGRALQFLIGPLQALFASWRSISSYRNDEQIEFMSDEFNPSGKPDFFTTVVFESPAQVPMS